VAENKKLKTISKLIQSVIKKATTPVSRFFKSISKAFDRNDCMTLLGTTLFLYEGLVVFFEYCGWSSDLTSRLSWAAVVFLLIFAVILVINLKKNKKTIKAKNGINIVIKEGNLFNIEDKEKNYAIVIPVDTRFNTDLSIIGEETVHAQFIREYKKNNNNNIKSLDKQIEKDLGSKNGIYDESIPKVKGKQTSYPHGEVAKIVDEKAEKVFFLLAFGELKKDKDYDVYCSPEEYCTTFFGLLRRGGSYTDIRRLYMPVMGTGRTRGLHEDRTIMIELMISLIKAFNDKNPIEINIIVHENDAKEIIFPHFR